MHGLEQLFTSFKLKGKTNYMRYLEWFWQGIFCCTPFTNYPTNRDYETTCSILQTDASLCEYIFCYLFLYNTVKTFKSVTLKVKFEINA